MKFPESSPVRESKKEDLKKRMAKLGIAVSEIEETFSKGSGKGGQKINKTANAVILRYPALKITVKCQRERQRSLNRFIALRQLIDKAEYALCPGISGKSEKIRSLRRKKARKKRKSRKKYEKD